jgi:hypothetical protein
MNTYEKRTATILERISAKEYMWRYHHGEATNEAYNSTVRLPGSAMLIQWPKGGRNVGSHNLMDATGELCWKDQIVESVSSNLGRGKGAIWYFVCKDCSKRVKHLYFDNYLRAPLCRRCCKLPYRQPTRPERKISRYLTRHPEIITRLINSGEVPAY